MAFIRLIINSSLYLFRFIMSILIFIKSGNIVLLFQWNKCQTVLPLLMNKKLALWRPRARPHSVFKIILLEEHLPSKKKYVLVKQLINWLGYLLNLFAWRININYQLMYVYCFMGISLLLYNIVYTIMVVLINKWLQYWCLIVWCDVCILLT